MSDKNFTGFEIAVIGMAGRFPGAADIHEFWNNLKEGRETITFFSHHELDEVGIDPGEMSHPHYIKAAGLIEDIDWFDADFFKYTGGDAGILDPQVRMFLECTWNALEDAGVNPDTYRGLIGLYAGASGHFEWEGPVYLSAPGDPAGQFSRWQLSDKDFLSTHISYKLNLKGPSITVYTACSTSLAAIHMACRALLYGECSMALAGGVTAKETRKSGYRFQEGMIASADGHCRSFDARASGTIFGDGAGIVALKRLKNAIEDKDHIYALVKGSFMNNDGNRKIGYTAPSIDGQMEVIQLAQRMARVSPESITYIEAHGTGTALGDPVEIEALKSAFNTGKKNYCAVGAIKSNIGHLDIAAGIAGFIKTVLALNHHLIPPSLHFNTPNPKIDFENSPFYVNTHLKEWKNNTYPLRAGVSSFGIGGTNVHVILEQAPEGKGGDETSTEYQLILLSAKTPSALDKMTENLAEYFKKSLLNPGNRENPVNPGQILANTAYTLQVGRNHFQHRKMLLARTGNEIIQALDDHGSREVRTAFTPNKKEVVFMFPGQGAQYVNMGWDLYQKESLFREETDRCFEILNGLDYDIEETLYPFYRSNRSYTSNQSYTSHINQTEIAQPAIFIIEYALAKLSMKWGITPAAMIGHSIGEYVAACLAGTFSLKDALALVAVRGKLMQKMPKGAMLSVSLAEDELIPLLNDQLAIAAVNTPSLCTVSGTNKEINRLAEQLKEKGHNVRLLHTSHAFHSPMMDPIMEEFNRHVQGITLEKPRIPFISNVTGFWITDEEAVNPGYWTQHLRRTVRFSQGLVPLLEEEHTLFVEVGPGGTLSSFVRQHSNRKSNHYVVNLLRHPKETFSDIEVLQERIGLMWLYGAPIDWNSYSDNRQQRISLPTYPFERKPCRIENISRAAVSKKTNPRDWFYIPNWKRTPVPFAPAPNNTGGWLFFIDEDGPGIGALLVEQLRAEGEKVIIVKAAADSDFSSNSRGEFVINPAHEEHYHTLLTLLHRQGKLPQRIVHLWHLITYDQQEHFNETYEKYLDRGFYSLIRLAQAIGGLDTREKIQLIVLSNHMQMVGGEEIIIPQKATVLGPVMIIPREYSNILCRSIDIQLPARESRQEKKLLMQLAAELKTDTPETIIAYRNNHRLVQGFEPLPPGKWEQMSLPFKEKGVYLITGGLGGIGLVLAEYLFRNIQARLILTARSPLSQKETAKQKVKELENSGAEILVFEADVSDERRMKAVIQKAEEKFGPVNGVIHCAGIAGEGIVQLKTREMADKVLEPKVKGTLVLDRLFRHHHLDFFAACSSINSVIPRPGQVDYCAANAFLDSFAWYKTSGDGTFTLSINWDTWQELGMAAATVRQQMEIKQGHHPLLEKTTLDKTGREIYCTHLDFNQHWVLNEHQAQGQIGLLPGTTYLEMVRAALEHTGSKIMEIQEVRFLNPLIAVSGEQKEIALVLKHLANSFDFSVVSINENDENLQTHAQGTILINPQGKSKKYNIKELETQCEEHQTLLNYETNTIANGLLVIGPRWKSLKRVKYTKNQGLAFLELDGAYVNDLQSYKLHPALLDIATAFLYNYINTENPYIPFSYKRLTIKKDLPAKFYSYSRWLEESSSKALLKFNVTLIDEQGEELVDIEEFTLLEVTGELMGRMTQSLVEKPAAANAPDFPDAPVKNKKPGTSILDMLISRKDFLEHGILPSEGIEVFLRLLGMGLPQVVVSTTDLQQRWPGPISSPGIPDEDGTIGPLLQARPGISTTYVPPGTETQQLLAKTWQQVLGIQQVGIHDDFFELGADSLKAITVIARIHKDLKVEIPIGEFFNHPTVKKLEQYINRAETGSYSSIEPMEEKEYYPLSSAQERFYILQKMDMDSTVYNLPFTQLVQGSISKEKLEDSFKKLIRRHESLRTSFEVIKGEPVQKVHKKTKFAIEYHELSEEKAVPLIAAFIRPFDLDTPPLFRVGLIKLGDREHIFILDMHHLITDLTSLSIFTREALTFYPGQEIPPLRLQYKDFCQWQKNQLISGKLKEQEEYWLNQLHGELPVLKMPTDYPRPSHRSFAGDVIYFIFDKDLTGKLNQLIKETNTTLYIMLLTLFNILLSKYTGQKDIIIGSPIAGRNHTDLENIIGLLIETIVIRNYPVGNKTIAEFLEEVKNSTLKAYQNQGYPFGELLKHVNHQSHRNRNPLFDAMLIVLNVDIIPADRETGKLNVVTYNPGEGSSHRVSKVDLTLEAREEKGMIFLNLEYCTSLFKKETMEKFVNSFIQIVLSVVENKKIQLKDITISHDLKKAAPGAYEDAESEFEL